MTWKAKKGDSSNGGYTKELLEEIFSLVGNSEPFVLCYILFCFVFVFCICFLFVYLFVFVFFPVWRSLPCACVQEKEWKSYCFLP